MFTRSLSGKQKSFLPHIFLISLVIGVFFSTFTWTRYNQVLYTATTLLFPLALGYCRTRLECFILSLIYFCPLWFPCIKDTRIFFGHSDYVGGVVIFLLAVGLSTLPFVVLWTYKQIRYLTLFTALLIYSFSPIGIASPLTGAVALFPGLGWLGFFFALALCFSLIYRKRVLVITLAVTSISSVCSIATFRVPNLIPGWIAVDTYFGGGEFPLGDIQEDWIRIHKMFDTVANSPRHVIFFPETVLVNWSDFSDQFFRKEFQSLHDEGTLIAWGSETLQANGIHDNVYILRGIANEMYQQRFPIPLAMWGNGVSSHIVNRSVVKIGRRIVGIMLCYEQLLPFAILETFSYQPDVIIAPSNLYWSEEKIVEQLQTNTLRSWCNLFATPYYHPVNH